MNYDKTGKLTDATAVSYEVTYTIPAAQMETLADGYSIVTETIRSQLRQGKFIAAYAEAATLFCNNPADYPTGLLLLEAAFSLERPENATALLADLKEKIPAQAFSLLNLQISLFTGDGERIQHYWQTANLTENTLIYHEFAYHIERQRHHLTGALEQLDAMERLAARPLKHFLTKFEILKLQGRYDTITGIIHQLMQQTAPESIGSRWILQLAEIMVAHDQLRFQESVALSQTLIASYLATPIMQHHTAPPPAKPWTQRRQHQVMADLERVIQLTQLPICLVAGSLLALAREGDFFLTDKDIDLAVLGMSAEDAAQILAATGLFVDASPPGYFNNFKIMRHCRSGFTVDITGYQHIGSKRVARWQHSSGHILREAVFPNFNISVWDHPALRCRIPVPDDIDSCLSSVYGDWRTPDPFFETVVAAHNLTGLTDYLISNTYISIANALIINAHKKAKSLAGYLQGYGVQSDLFGYIYDLSE